MQGNNQPIEPAAGQILKLRLRIKLRGMKEGVIPAAELPPKAGAIRKSGDFKIRDINGRFVLRSAELCAGAGSAQFFNRSRTRAGSVEIGRVLGQTRKHEEYRGSDTLRGEQHELGRSFNPLSVEKTSWPLHEMPTRVVRFFFIKESIDVNRKREIVQQLLSIVDFNNLENTII